MKKSSLHPTGSGPIKFLIDVYDLMQGIHHYKTLAKTKYNLNIQLQHIYSHLDVKKKQEKIIKSQGLDILNHHLKTPWPKNEMNYTIKKRTSTIKTQNI